VGLRVPATASAVQARNDRQRTTDNVVSVRERRPVDAGDHPQGILVVDEKRRREDEGEDRDDPAAPRQWTITGTVTWVFSHIMLSVLIFSLVEGRVMQNVSNGFFVAATPMGVRPRSCFSS
jgi:hypothetical protein